MPNSIVLLVLVFFWTVTSRVFAESFSLDSVSISSSLAKKIRSCCKMPRTAPLTPLMEINCRQNVVCFRQEMDKVAAAASNVFNRQLLRELPPQVIETIKSQCQRGQSKTQEAMLQCWQNVVNAADPTLAKPPMNKKVVVVLLKRFINHFHSLPLLSMYCHRSALNLNFNEGGGMASLKDQKHECGKVDLNLMRFGSVPYHPYPYDQLPGAKGSGSGGSDGVEEEGGGDQGSGSGSGGGVGTNVQGNDKVLDALFNVTDASGWGEGIECPSFIPKVFCGDDSKFNPLHYEYSDDIWPPRYNPTANLDLGSERLGEVMDEIYGALKDDFRQQMLHFLLQLHAEKYLEASLLSLGSAKGMAQFAELEKISCNNDKVHQISYLDILKNVKGNIPGRPEMIDDRMQSRARETVLAAHCMEAIEDRLRHLKSLFGMDISPARKILDADNTDNPVAKIAIKTAAQIPVIGGLLANSSSISLAEDAKRLCGRTSMLAQGGGLFTDYVDPAHPEKGGVPYRPQDGWSRVSYCNTAFKEYEDLSVEIGRIYSKFPILGEGARGDIPVYKELNRIAGDKDSARNLTRHYNRDYHLPGSARRNSCLASYVNSQGQLGVSPSGDAVSSFMLRQDLFIGDHLRSIQAQMKAMCESPDKFIDSAIKNPLFMKKYFTCSRVPLLEFATAAGVSPGDAAKTIVDKKSCDERYSMTWLACRAYKDTKEDDGIAKALSTTLLAAGELTQLLPFGSATKAGASIVLRDVLSGAAFSGLLTMVTAKDRDELVEEQRQRAAWARAGLGSLEDFNDATQAIVKLRADVDPKIIEIISSVLGSATNPISAKEWGDGRLFNDSLSKAGRDFWLEPGHVIKSAIRERMENLKSLYAKVKDGAKRGLFGDEFGEVAHATLDNFIDQQRKMLRHMMLQLKIKTGLYGDDILEELLDRKHAVAVVANKHGGKSFTFKGKRGTTVIRHYDKSDRLLFQTSSQLGDDLSDFGRGTLYQTNIFTPDGAPAGHFQYDCMPPGCSKVANIDVIVHEKMWNRGIYAEQLDQMLRDHPDIRVIEGELMYSNARAYRDLLWGSSNKERIKHLAGDDAARAARLQGGLFNDPAFEGRPIAASIEAFEGTPAGKWRKRNGFCTHVEMPGTGVAIKEPPPPLSPDVRAAIGIGKVKFVSVKCSP